MEILLSSRGFYRVVDVILSLSRHGATYRLAVTGLTMVVIFLFLSALAGEANPQHHIPPPAAGPNPGKPVPGEHYRWRPVMIGGGGFLTGLAQDDAGATLLARTDVHGAYRWDAGLDQWVQLATAQSMPPEDRVQNGVNEGAYEVAVAPGDARRLYMATKGRVYRSDDGGAHWVTGNPRPQSRTMNPNAETRFLGPFMAVSPHDPNLILWGTPADGLLRSTDGAQSWQAVESIPRADGAVGASIWFARGGTGAIFVSVPGKGMFQSRDQGNSFTPIGSGGPQSVRQAAFAPDGAFVAIEAQARVWRWKNGRWAQISNPSALPKGPLQAIAIQPKNGDIYVFDQGGNAVCAPGGTDRWQSLSRSSAAGPKDPPWLKVADQGYFAIAAASFDPRTPTRLQVAAGTGFYVADTTPGCGRLALVSQTRGIEELVARDVIQPMGRPPLFAALDFGIHAKEDLNAFSTSYGPRERVLIAAEQLDWSEGDPDFVVTNASDTRLTCCAEDGDAVMAGYSVDGGFTWRKFPTLPTPPGTKADDPRRMAFGTIAVAARDTRNIVWAPAMDRSPFYTLDRGATWNRVMLPGESLPNTGSFGNLYLTRKTLAADRALPRTFYLVHSGTASNKALTGLWRSDDGGVKWRRVFSGEIAPYSNSAAKLRAVPGQAGHLFFTNGNAEGDTRLRRSTDGGATWAIVAGISQVDDIAFGKAAVGAAYPAIYISGKKDGRYGLWRSVDDATSWQRLVDFPLGRLDQAMVLEADKQLFGRLYVGYAGSGWIYGEPVTERGASADRNARGISIVE